VKQGHWQDLFESAQCRESIVDTMMRCDELNTTIYLVSAVRIEANMVDIKAPNEREQNNTQNCNQLKLRQKRNTHLVERYSPAAVSDYVVM
jgi:hypothetical protein